MKLVAGILVLLVVVGGALLVVKRKHSTARPHHKFSEEEYNRHYESKRVALEKLLGPMHTFVGHAIIPFQIGGAVDLYYFPNGIPGTGFATMELIEPDGTGPKPNRIGTYELVAFTKLKIPPPEQETAKDDPFKKMRGRVCGILTAVGRYSYEEVLNPGETCELPQTDKDPGVCLILDEYQKDGASFQIDGKKHCLLLCIEVFRTEMDYAMKHGSATVLKKLKERGYYPYSDLDREPVF